MVVLGTQVIVRRKPLATNARIIAGVFFLGTLLQGCVALVPQTAALRDGWPDAVPEQVELTDAPFFPQREYQCGPAALATALAYFKVPVTADDLVAQVYIPERKGSVPVEMLAAPRRYGMVSYALAPKFEDVLREIAAGTPVVVLQNYGIGPFKRWHYATAVGYDAKVGSLTLRSGEWRRWWMPLAVFEYTWKDSGYWAMVAVPPDRIPATADRARYLEALVAFERAGDAKAAVTAYRRYLERWPDELAASVGLANAYYGLGKLKSVEGVLSEALKRNPESPVVINNLAHTLSEQGRNGEALELIERAPASGPHTQAIRETRSLIEQRLQER
ncbi:MAG: PA2778 family cysteine peptidase [Burkholderiales bacterium]